MPELQRISLGCNDIGMAMTLEQYAQKIKELIEKSRSKAISNIMVSPANRLLATVKNRIIIQGENTAGNQIGQYSTKPMYASKKQFDKKRAFKPIKKKYVSTDAKAPKTVKGRKVLGTIYTETGKTMYLQQGYKELRQIQDKPVDKVNLQYRGDLLLSYQQDVIGEGVIVQGLNKESEKKKRQGLEKRFKAPSGLLHPQQKEIDEYKKAIIENTKLEILKIIGRNA